MRLLLIVFLSLAFVPGVAHAYIGPGLGVGAIAAVLGVISAVLLAIFAVVYYPIKRAMRKRKGAGKPEPSATAGNERADPGE